MLRVILTDPCCVAALVAAAGIGLWQAGVWLVRSFGRNRQRFSAEVLASRDEGERK